MFDLRLNPSFAECANTLFTKEVAAGARAFHSRIPGYRPTPLISLPHLAAACGVRRIFIKDESRRFGLGAFKVLGGSYALARVVARDIGAEVEDINFETMSQRQPGQYTFVTATAGNHGIGIAWSARKMGQRAIVYMPKGAARASVERVRALGADCIVTEVNYDDTVKLAHAAAAQKGYVLVQDTAWAGYETIPTWISQGYTTMAAEALEQLHADFAVDAPTHVFLQAGVGAMAGGVLGYLENTLGPGRFRTIISEPETAACLYASAFSAEQALIPIRGSLDSIMAGLACGEVNPVTWPILKSNTLAFATADDSVAATGMRILGNPLHDDPAVTSGPSGAINVGLLYAMTKHEEAERIRALLGLSAGSKVLIFNTEGGTNEELYRRVVWDGAYSLS